MTETKFPDILRSLRKLSGLRQRHLANDFHTSVNTVLAWEKGEREPEYQTLKALARYFNVSLDLLLGNEAELPVPTNFDMWKETLTPKDINRFLLVTCDKCPAAGVTCQRFDYECKSKFRLWAHRRLGKNYEDTQEAGHGA